jgi:type IV secretion system protein TrbL
VDGYSDPGPGQQPEIARQTFGLTPAYRSHLVGSVASGAFAWVVLGGVAHAATGALATPQIFDFNAFQTVMQTWWTPLWREARFLFMTLAVVSAVWQFGFLALRKADFGEFFVELVRYILFTGFFYWLLVYGVFLGQAIIESFLKLGEASSGGGLTFTGLTSTGMSMVTSTWKQLTGLGPFDIGNALADVVGLFVAIVFTMVLAFIYIVYLLKMAGVWFLLYGGILFLGFGGARWTSDWAIGYFKSLLAACAELFGVILIAGLAEGLVQQYFATLATNSTTIIPGGDLGSAIMLLIVSIMFLFLANKLPPMLAGVLGGSPGGHIAGGGAAELVGSAVGLGTLAAGGAMAFGAATKAAKGAMSGGDAVKAAAGAAGDAGGGGGGGGGSVPSPVPSPSGGGLGAGAAAFGKSLAGSIGEMASIRAARTPLGRAGQQLQKVAKAMGAGSAAGSASGVSQGSQDQQAASGPETPGASAEPVLPAAADVAAVQQSLDAAVKAGRMTPEQAAEAMEFVRRPLPSGGGPAGGGKATD